MTDAPARPRVSVLDLTVAQLEALELELGLPIDQWDQLKSRAQLYRRVYAAVTGASDAEVAGMTMREVIESVDLLGDSEGAETGNPTQPTG